jgi:glucose/arabinose dehydrogenase
MTRPRHPRPVYWLVAALILAPLLTLATPTPAAAATLPPGLVDELVVGGLGTPTALAFTPDGRMLVAAQTGQLMVYRDGVLQAQALNLATGNLVCTESEQGLLGIAIDPAFTQNRTIFLYYTARESGTCVNRVSRFTLSDNNTINLDSETVLLDNMPSPNGNHNGGDLNFGQDGFLYVSIGEGGVASNARQLNVLSGKILRITRDGGIPAGNPYQGQGTARCNTGATTPGTRCQEIYATGLRNPFRFAFDPNASGTRFFINDVGGSTWEEIDLGQPGADYGWNVREGFCAIGSTTNCGAPPSGMTNPLYAYGRSTGCRSITGGAFVPNGVWGASFDGAYVFGDFTCDRFFVLRQGGNGNWNASTLASGLGHTAVHLRFGPYLDTQALYYTSYGEGGQVRRLVQRFTDVSINNASYNAAEQLRARGLVRGYGAAGCASRGVADPCFGPGDTSLRAQMAVMIVRAMGWSGEQAQNPFTDRGTLDPELWDAVAILASRGIALGYGDGRFGPNDEITQAQLVSFIARAMIERGYWQPAEADNPAIYPNVPASTGHRLDLVTYVRYVGSLPDHPANANWASWSAPATRGWFARTLWQALEPSLTAP